MFCVQLHVTTASICEPHQRSASTIRLHYWVNAVPILLREQYCAFHPTDKRLQIPQLPKLINFTTLTTLLP